MRAFRGEWYCSCLAAWACESGRVSISGCALFAGRYPGGAVQRVEIGGVRGSGGNGGGCWGRVFGIAMANTRPSVRPFRSVLGAALGGFALRAELSSTTCGGGERSGDDLRCCLLLVVNSAVIPQVVELSCGFRASPGKKYAFWGFAQ